MKKIRRALSLLLALCLLLSVLPVRAAARNDAQSSEDDVFYKIVHLDCGRKYFTVDSIKDLIDSMALSGYNQLQLYVSDNQGFRLALDDMNITVDGHTYSLSSALGSGYEEPSKGMYPDEDTRYLTQAEMDKIIRYANSKGLEVVPSVNMPGHMGAILEQFPQFRWSVGDVVSKSTLDILDPEAVSFGLAILEKYAGYFKSRGCRYFNIGADEFANDGNFGFSYLKNNADKYAYFVSYVNRSAELLLAQGLIPRLFNDGMYLTGDYSFNPAIEVCYWSNTSSLPAIVSKGHALINTSYNTYYVPGKNIINDTRANGYNVNSFYGGGTATAVGSMFCIWNDNANAATQEAVIETASHYLSLLGPRMDATNTSGRSAYRLLTQGNVTVRATSIDALSVSSAQVPVLSGYLAYTATPSYNGVPYIGGGSVSIDLRGTPLAQLGSVSLGGGYVNADGSLTYLDGQLSGGSYSFDVPSFAQSFFVYDKQVSLLDPVQAGLQATARYSSNRLSWIPVDGAQRYAVERSSDNTSFDSLVILTGGASAAYIDETAGAGTRYYYRLAVTLEGGVAYSESVRAGEATGLNALMDTAALLKIYEEDEDRFDGTRADILAQGEQATALNAMDEGTIICRFTPSEPGGVQAVMGTNSATNYSGISGSLFRAQIGGKLKAQLGGVTIAADTDFTTLVSFDAATTAWLLSSGGVSGGGTLNEPGFLSKMSDIDTYYAGACGTSNYFKGSISYILITPEVLSAAEANALTAANPDPQTEQLNPTELSVTARYSSNRLSWTPEEGCTYAVQRSKDGADFSTLRAQDREGGYIDETAGIATQHYYRLEVTADGKTSYTAPVQAAYATGLDALLSTGTLAKVYDEGERSFNGSRMELLAQGDAATALNAMTQGSIIFKAAPSDVSSTRAVLGTNSANYYAGLQSTRYRIQVSNGMRAALQTTQISNNETYTGAFSYELATRLWAMSAKGTSFNGILAQPHIGFLNGAAGVTEYYAGGCTDSNPFFGDIYYILITPEVLGAEELTEITLANSTPGDEPHLPPVETDLGAAFPDMLKNTAAVDANNTWLFSGAAQGSFSNIGGARSYPYHFEEYVRWTLASVASEWYARQRYILNAGSSAQSLAETVASFDALAKSLDPRAAVYLVGEQDYQAGAAGLEAFRANLSTYLSKALALRDGTGFAVIQTPYPVSGEARENAAAYAQAVRDVVDALDDAAKPYVQIADHYASEDWSAEDFNADGALSAAGHLELGRQLCAALFGTLSNYPASGVSADFPDLTPVSAPRSYLTDAPVIAAGSSSLSVTLPASAGSGTWNCTLALESYTLSQQVTGSAFTLSQLPADEPYTLTITASDWSVRLPVMTGIVAQDAPASVRSRMLDANQQAIVSLAEQSEPLTWLFMGDSITHGALHLRGYDSVTQSFEKYLRDDLGRTDDLVINTAVSSATTADTLANLEYRLLKYQPDIVSIMLGTNDAMGESSYKANLRAIIVAAQEAGAKVILRTPICNRDALREKLGTYAGYMRDVAAEYADVILIDQYSMWLSLRTQSPYLLASLFNDNLHPKANGQLLMLRQFVDGLGLPSDSSALYALSYETGTASVSSAIVPELLLENGSASVNAGTLAQRYGADFSALTLCAADKDGRSYSVTCGGTETATLKNLPESLTFTVTAQLKNADTLVAFAPVNTGLPSFAVTLPSGAGYVAAPVAGSSSPVVQGGSYSFTVTLTAGYEKDETFAVKANGVPLTAVNGVFTIEAINEAQTVTVEGVKLVSSQTLLKAGSDQMPGGTTTEQPFADGTGGSQNFRIPALITLPDGTLVAAMDARYATASDGGGLDTIVSISKDNGATWRYSFPIFFPDSDGYAGTSATTVIDPVLIHDESGRIYLMSDVNPTGITTLYTNPLQGTGYINVDGVERLALTSVYANADIMPRDDDTRTYEYYVGDFDESGYAPVIRRSDGSADTGYAVDSFYNIYAVSQGIYAQLAQKQVNSDTQVQQNAFYRDSALHVYNTGYMWLSVSDDGGETWTHEILNPQIKRDAETILLVSPGRGTLAQDGTIIIPFYTWDTSVGQQATFIFSKDGGRTWTRNDDLPMDGVIGGSSENEIVSLSDGTLRMFLRTGKQTICYADASWDSEAGQYLWGTQVNTGVRVTSSCNLTAIAYSRQIDGRDALLVSYPGGSGRANGKIFTFLVNADNTLALKSTYQVNEGTYKYSSMTELNDGTIGLLYEGPGGTGVTNVYTAFTIDTLLAGSGTVGAADARSYSVPLFGTRLLLVDGEPDTTALDTAVATVAFSNGAVTISGVSLGTTAFTAGGVTYTITVEEGEHIDVTVAVGESKAYSVGHGVISKEGDKSVADYAVTSEEQTVTVTGAKASTGSSSAYNEGEMPLSDALVRFSSHPDAQGFALESLKNPGVYVSLAAVGYASVSTSAPESFTVAALGNGFSLYSSTHAKYLYFWNAASPNFGRFDRVSTLPTDTSSVTFQLYRPARTGENASSEIPGYVALKSVNEISAGGLYLIAIQADGSYYVLNPTGSTENYYRHVAKVNPDASATAEYSGGAVTTLSITGVKVGETSIVVDDVIYYIEVTDGEPAPTYTVTLPTGTGYSAQAAEGSSSPVDEGGSYSFTVVIADGYAKGASFAVKANGVTLTEVNGVYTIRGISADQTVTVEGVERVVIPSYTVTLPTGTGYSAKAAEGSSSPVDKGGSYSFTVVIADGYAKGASFAVKANGVTLTEVNGVYTIRGISADQTVTVEGVERVVIPSYTVTLPTGTGYSAQAAEGSSSPVDKGGSYSFTLTFHDGYRAGSGLSVSANGRPLYLSADGVYTITGITAPQTITVRGVERKPSIALTQQTISLPWNVRLDELQALDLREALGQYTVLRVAGLELIDSDPFVRSASYSDMKLHYSIDAGLREADAGRSNTLVITLETQQELLVIPVIVRLTAEPDTSLPFVDVAKGSWYYDDVAYVFTNSLMNGTSSTLFAPNAATSRAMLVTVLYRLAGAPEATRANPFKDVKSNMWYTNAVLWAAENGLVKGYGDGSFGPNDPVTRAQLAVILYRYAQMCGYPVEAQSPLDSYADADAVPGWADAALRWAAAEGLLNGVAEGGKTYLLPLDSTTRAQIAAVLHRFCENFVN